MISIIDAHAHLWLNVDTVVNGSPIHALEPNRSRSLFFGEERQMLPPYMIDGQNTAERFLSNMDYAQVSAAVITQEFIDGLQNSYLLQVQQRYPDRFFCFGMPELRNPGFCDEAKRLIAQGFRGIKVPAARLPQQFLNDEMMQMFHYIEQHNIILGIELMDGDAQVAQMEAVIHECPQLKLPLVTSVWSHVRTGCRRYVLLAMRMSTLRVVASHGFSTTNSIPILQPSRPSRRLPMRWGGTS